MGILRLSTLMLVTSLTLCHGADIVFTNKTVSFTNLEGKVYSDVQLVRADNYGLVWMTEGASGGRVSYTNLPPLFLEALGIPTNRINSAKLLAKQMSISSAIDQQNAVSAAQLQADIRQAEAEVNSSKQVFTTGLEVMQRVGGDALVMYGHSTIYYVMDCPEKWVDGDWVSGTLYPIGSHEYTTVNGSSKTVRKFTFSFEHAIMTRPVMQARTAKRLGEIMDPAFLDAIKDLPPQDAKAIKKRLGL